MPSREDCLSEDKGLIRNLLAYPCSDCDKFYFSNEKGLEKCPKGHKYSGSREVRGDVVPTVNGRENVTARLEDSFK